MPMSCWSLPKTENEANGPTAAAYDAVNQLRVRAGLDNLSGLSKETFRQAIQKEWTLETTHERIYRFNLVRWGTYLTVMKEYFQKNFSWKGEECNGRTVVFPLSGAWFIDQSEFVRKFFE